MRAHVLPVQASEIQLSRELQRDQCNHHPHLAEKYRKITGAANAEFQLTRADSSSKTLRCHVTKPQDQSRRTARTRVASVLRGDATSVSLRTITISGCMLLPTNPTTVSRSPSA